MGYSTTTNNDNTKDKTDDRHENTNQEQLGLTQIHQNNKQADKQPSQQENKKDNKEQTAKDTDKPPEKEDDHSEEAMDTE